MAKKITIEIITALLFILWIYAATSKLLDYEAFKVQLGKSPLLTNFAGFAAIAVPVSELLIATLLLFKRIVGLYASLFLLIMFTSYLLAILNFSYYIPCSCAGIIGNNLGWKAHIVFNGGFIIANMVAVFLYQRSPAIGSKATQSNHQRPFAAN